MGQFLDFFFSEAEGAADAPVVLTVDDLLTARIERLCAI